MTTRIIKTAEPTKTSNHVGGIGDRIHIRGVMRKIIGHRPCINIIHDHDGNEFICRSARPLASGPRVLMDLTATITAHSEYQMVKRTEIAEVKLFKYED